MHGLVALTTVYTAKWGTNAVGLFLKNARTARHAMEFSQIRNAMSFPNILMGCIFSEHYYLERII